jgi:enediyne biosynthesis protein E4
MGPGRVRQWWVLGFLLAGLSIAGGWRWWTIRNYRRALAEIHAAMAAGRPGTAIRGLTSLLDASPDADEVAYLLGSYERGRGRPEAADLAWAKVTPGSSLSARAIEGRMLLRVASGQFAAAEQLIDEAAADRRNDGTALRILLVQTYFDEGRLDDALRLVDARLDHLRQIGEGASHTAIVLARLHFDLEQTSTPVETARATLERAGRMAPKDDRVWLGRANLALRTGDLHESARWLDACQRLRPDDMPVWRARMRFAMADGQVDHLKKALRHLPASASTPVEVHHIRAWLAKQQGDQAIERQELTLALAASPADRTALDRLSALAEAGGQAEQLARLKHHKAEIERMTARYKKLIGRNQPIRDSSEMGLLAEKLGRPVEARVYLGIAAAESLHRDQASRDLARLDHQPAGQSNATDSLAEIVGAETGVAQPTQSTVRPQDP